jgi:predicted RNA-binding Zn ribbon-like protein
MSSKTFDLEAGVLCLDFANTVEWHASEHPQDKLTDYSDLLAWGEAAGELLAERAKHLRRLAMEQPGQATAAFDRAIQLREAIYRIFTFLATNGEVASDDLAILNEVVRKSFVHLRVTSSSTGFSWDWNDEPEALDQVLWPVVRSAAELLTSENLDRVRQCADDRGCGYLFIDMSRNRSRRWCSMEACGNRAKARRHYRRAMGNV